MAMPLLPLQLYGSTDLCHSLGRARARLRVFEPAHGCVTFGSHVKNGSIAQMLLGPRWREKQRQHSHDHARVID